MCAGGIYSGQTWFFVFFFNSDFLLKLEEVKKCKSRIRLEERRMQSGVTERPSDCKAKDLNFASLSHCLALGRSAGKWRD